MTYEINCGSFSSSELWLDKNELASRLCVPKGYDVNFAAKCFSLVESAMNVKYCYAKFPVKIQNDRDVDLGFDVFTSKNLAKNLEGCEFAYVLALSLGIGVDRLVARLAVTSKAESFIADAVASAYAEAGADLLSEKLSESCSLKPRFSPGYGDLSLSVQPKVLDAVNAEKLVGITLNDSLLMTPCKSITAIQGIKSK